MTLSTPRLSRATRTRRRTLGVAVTLILLGGAGCGSSGGDTATESQPADGGATTTMAAADDGATTPAGAKDIDACALLEGIDLEALLGTPVADGVTKDDYGIAMCDVRAAEEGVRSQFALMVDPNEGVDNYELQLGMADDNEVVKGLGDKAFRRASTLFVLDGDMLVYVNALADQGDVTRTIPTEELKPVLQKVLDRLHS